MCMNSRGARRAVGYALAEAFAALTELTAPLPRCGVKDTAPLLEMTRALGEWMQLCLSQRSPAVRPLQHHLLRVTV
jgi:hypothetical protein